MFCASLCGSPHTHNHTVNPANYKHSTCTHSSTISTKVERSTTHSAEQTLTQPYLHTSCSFRPTLFQTNRYGTIISKGDTLYHEHHARRLMSSRSDCNDPSTVSCHLGTKNTFPTVPHQLQTRRSASHKQNAGPLRRTRSSRQQAGNNNLH